MTYPSNAQRRSGPRKEAPTAAEPKKIEKVIEGTVVHRKKSVGKRFKEAIVGQNDRSIMEFVIQDVFIPGIKDMLFEGQQRAAEQLFYGDSPGGARRHIRYGDPRRGLTNYNARSNRSREPEVISPRARARHDFGEIVIPSRPEAVAVLEQMFALLEQYDEVTVADLYELVGTSGQFTDQNWGWTDLRGSDVRAVREGYLLILPPTEPLAR